ncbi:McrC family protein [Sphingopyxis terrae]|uniref:McrC family protein n=1 Tax=Sphingopyxis terrae TaxID=33052 RepID=UPI001C2C6990|nr:McrC family protein [Sphingopyxis terrae]QXF12877.1 restriction endonuclease [Sphingopyxis terrae subsp. terrae]
MIHRTVSEWNYLTIDPPGDGAFTRELADRLIVVAGATDVGGTDGERIFTDHHRRLRAQQVVGVIAAQGCSVEILPKIEGLGTAEDEAGRTNIRGRLIHMLAAAYDLDLSVGEAVQLGSQKHTILEVLIGLFCRRLNDALREGMPRRYVGQEDDLAVLRGRLDVQRQFTTLAFSPQKMACRFEELTPDIPLNQVFKAAIGRLAQVSRAPENQRRLRELGLIYSDISLVPIGALRWDAITLDRTNHRWRGLRDLARLLLQGDYQTTSHGRAPGFSLLFPMNDLFEIYIARMLEKALKGTGLSVRAQDRRHYCLVDQAGSRRFQVRLDIVVYRGSEPVMVIDTKWKRISDRIEDAKQGVGQADVYQMMAYSRLYGCPRVMLLYPHHAGLNSHGETGRYKIAGCDHELVTATVDISASSISEQLVDLCSELTVGLERSNLAYSQLQ